MGVGRTVGILKWILRLSLYFSFAVAHVIKDIFLKKG